MRWNRTTTKMKPVKILQYDGTKSMTVELLKDSRFTMNYSLGLGHVLTEKIYDNACNCIYLKDSPVIGGMLIIRDDFIVEFENGEIIIMDAAAAGFLLNAKETNNEN